MMTTRVFSSVSGRSASLLAVEVGLEVDMITGDFLFLSDKKKGTAMP